MSRKKKRHKSFAIQLPRELPPPQQAGGPSGADPSRRLPADFPLQADAGPPQADPARLPPADPPPAPAAGGDSGAAPEDGAREGRLEASLARGGAPELFGALLERFRERCPGWTGGLEDPAAVILELWAELSASLRSRLAEFEDRAAETIEDGIIARIIEASGLDPLGPAPACGAVQFLRRQESGDEPAEVPAGTRFALARPDGEAPLVFETVEDCRVGGPHLLRAYAIFESELHILPLRHPGEDRPPDAAAPAPEAAAPFGGRTSAGRLVYLGDERFERLRDGPGPLVLEWPGAGAEVSEAAWEYWTRAGWRGLNPRFEAVPAAGKAPLLRMAISGPLPDLGRDRRGGALLPWFRAVFFAKQDLSLAAPVVAAEYSVPGAPEGGRGAVEPPRPVERLHAESGGMLEDFSLMEGTLRLAARPDLRDPMILLGFDRPAGASLFFDLEGSAGSTALLDRQASPPLWSWEFSDGIGWKPVPDGGIRDRTAGLQSRGSVHIRAPAGWSAREVCSEEMFWIRARWRGGDFFRPPSIAAIHPDAVEALQGQTLRRIPVPARQGGWRGWLPIEGIQGRSALPFDRLILESPRGAEHRERDDFRGPEPARSAAAFFLRRRPDGQFLLSFPEDAGGGGKGGAGMPPPEARVWIESLRSGVAGAAGNLPAGSAVMLEEEIPSISGARLVAEARGGADAEDETSLQARALAGRQAGDRAVTREDYLRLALALLPDLRGVEVFPDPGQPGGLIITLMPEGGGSVGPAARAALELFLEERSPPGTRIRAVEAVVVPAALELKISRRAAAPHARAVSPSTADLGRWLRDVLGARATNPAGGGLPILLPAPRWHPARLQEWLARQIAGSASHAALRIESLRLLKRPAAGSVREPEEVPVSWLAPACPQEKDRHFFGSLHNGFYRIYIELQDIVLEMI